MLDFVKNKFSAHGMSLRNFIFEMNVLKVAAKLGLKENNLNNNERACVLSISITSAYYQIDIGIDSTALKGTQARNQDFMWGGAN